MCRSLFINGHLSIIKPQYYVFIFGGNVAKYIHSSPVIKHNSETLVLYLSI